MEKASIFKKIWQWIWGMFTICFKLDKISILLEEVNNKLESPSIYKSQLEIFNSVTDQRIKLLEEQKKDSDSKKTEQIEYLIEQLQQSKIEIDKIKYERDINDAAMGVLAKKVIHLQDEIKKSQFIKLDPLQEVFAQAFPIPSFGSSDNITLSDALANRKFGQKV